MKYLFIPIIFISVLIFSGCGNQNITPTQDDSKIIFFYGQGCPHCKIVEEYFEKNGTREKIGFSEREIYHDKNNAALFEQKATACGIIKEEMGVPLLWTAEKCFVGDKDIISYFNQQLSADN